MISNKKEHTKFNLSKKKETKNTRSAKFNSKKEHTKFKRHNSTSIKICCLDPASQWTWS